MVAPTSAGTSAGAAYGTASNWVKTDLDGSTNSYISGLIIAPPVDQGQYALYGGSTHGDFNGESFKIDGEVSTARPDPYATNADLPIYEVMIIAGATYFSISPVEETA